MAMLSGHNPTVSDPKEHARGFALTLFGVLVLTPDTLLIRLIDIDPSTMNLWRGLLMSFSLTVCYIMVARGQAWAGIKALGFAGVSVALIYSINAITFVLAVDHTRVANVLIIIASTPLIAALLSIIFLKERVALPTWLAIAGAMAGVSIVVGDGVRAGTSLGDLLALVTAIALAVAFIIIRRNKHVNMVPATAVGALISALVAMPFAEPLQLEGARLGLLLLLGLVIMPLSFGLITLGPRTIPAPEVALLLLLETVLGPIWVWLVIDEKPSELTLVGGGVVITAVMLQSIWRLRRKRN
jgi:drug/metabolite transporter (DMT)-like permease